ncbi:MAG: undecaprenyl-phosphate glucose phosphotransferase [Oscillospiraceae bacterium]|nr:undecaprenyl-phosphate glucose phosphotransferase [Oscillospiraceae bacterium]
MIKDNQTSFNRLDVISDAVITFAMMPLAFVIRFYVLKNGIMSVPLRSYLLVGLVFALLQLVSFAAFGLYRFFWRRRLRDVLSRLCLVELLDIALVLGWLFLGHKSDYSRWTFAFFFILDVAALCLKRIAIKRAMLRRLERGTDRKNVLLLGSGAIARSYLTALEKGWGFGYGAKWYAARGEAEDLPLEYLGDYADLGAVMDSCAPDMVVCAVGAEDAAMIPDFIAVCEKRGVKLSIIPFYAEYLHSNPAVDDLNGVPLLNIRRVPLDDSFSAFVKRAFDVVCSALLLIVTSPLALVCAVGVKLSSPGPVIFRQERVGRAGKVFNILKFRSMRVNSEQDTAWSGATDGRRTRFGAFMRKCSLDELPQLWNVLKGDMSLVGPRPELPRFVERFREEIPLYMVKHQVRPGMTGWAQINGLRGDSSVKERIDHDLYYIENWTVWFDIQILLTTVFAGKFINDEKLGE